jgi:hypothetical protein
METYPTIKLTSEDNIDSFKKIFEAMSNNDQSEVKKHLNKFDASLAEKFDTIADIYGDYLESIEEIKVSGDKITVNFVCGSAGDEFLARLIELLAPYTTHVSGTFDHDEDYEEGESYVFSYQEGKVFLNNREYDYDD